MSLMIAISNFVFERGIRPGSDRGRYRGQNSQIHTTPKTSDSASAGHRRYKKAGQTRDDQHRARQFAKNNARRKKIGITENSSLTESLGISTEAMAVPAVNNTASKS
jgi:hypothetical protein